MTLAVPLCKHKQTFYLYLFAKKSLLLNIRSFHTYNQPLNWFGNKWSSKIVDMCISIRFYSSSGKGAHLFMNTAQDVSRTVRNVCHTKVTQVIIQFLCAIHDFYNARTKHLLFFFLLILFRYLVIADLMTACWSFIIAAYCWLLHDL